PPAACSIRAGHLHDSGLCGELAPRRRPGACDRAAVSGATRRSSGSLSAFGSAGRRRRDVGARLDSVRDRRLLLAVRLARLGRAEREATTAETFPAQHRGSLSMLSRAPRARLLIAVARGVALSAVCVLFAVLVYRLVHSP